MMRLLEPTAKKLNEDRPTLSAEKMQDNDSSFCRNIIKVYAVIRGGSSGWGRQTRVWWEVIF